MGDYTQDNLNNFNDSLDEIIGTNNNDLNYCKLIRPAKKGTLSVVAKYTPCYDEKFVTLSDKLSLIESNDYTNYYYGVSPKIDVTTIVDAISKLCFTYSQKLEKFISEHSNKFMLHKNQSEYLLPLAKYFVVALVSNFGIEFLCDDKFRNKIEKCEAAKNLTFKVDEKTNQISATIPGCPSEELLDLLKEYRFLDGQDQIELASNCQEGFSIQDIYANINNIKLLNGDVFYSGVLLKALKIEEQKFLSVNKNIVPMVIHFERSTYATVFALDNNFTEHPLLTDCKDKISEFLRNDDICKIKHLKFKNGKEQHFSYTQMVDKINDYLVESGNVNQICVSGNVITNDNILIIGIRSAQSIDSDKLYPSVNGNAELIDANVEFYLQSACEDYPRMSTDDIRKDFNRELSREAYAELGINLEHNEWECYGLSISGTIPPEDLVNGNVNYNISKRRMHFNVISSQQFFQSFTDVMKQKEKATESYENNDLHGINVKFYKSYYGLFADKIKSFISVINNSKDVITSVFTLALFFMSISTSDLLSLSSFSSIISAFFACIVLFTTITSVSKLIKEYGKKVMRIRNITIINNKHLNVRINKALKKYFSKYSYHPVTYVALRCYLESLLIK